MRSPRRWGANNIRLDVTIKPSEPCTAWTSQIWVKSLRKWFGRSAWRSLAFLLKSSKWPSQSGLLRALQSPPIGSDSRSGRRPDMSRMCCVGCNGVSLSIAGSVHVIKDKSSREWYFEQHHYFGPIVLRKDGEPKSRQPGSRSKFWPAYEAWRTSQPQAQPEH